ncbi:putative F-box protein At1g47730 [Rutidosis leptorrhynchoides]|uniref:putative F-box protein At1g47730 n=1 Tax=Rutidosis leptorrhynchoides TaxID=125765 RepID=UPI003A9A092D
MSDGIPFDIQTEIIRRLDVKSVLRSRSVSKSWKSLIDYPKFVASYGVDHIQMRVFLTSHPIKVWSHEYKSFVDDGDTLSFDQTLDPVPPKGPDNLHIIRIIGSSHGLICSACVYYNNGKAYGIYAIWNPFIRKSVGIEVPTSSFFKVYFGVCPVNLDPKLVKITIANSKWLVEIYTLSSDSWRKISNNMPRGTLEISQNKAVVVTDRFIYWVATDSAPVAANGNSQGNCLIIVDFDLTIEEFLLIEIPNFISPRELYDISKLRDSLVVLIYSIEAVTKNVGCEVWMMDNVQSKTMFNKLYNIEASNLILYGVRGFTKSGSPIIVMADGHDWKRDGLYVYEPKSKKCSTKITGIDRAQFRFDVYNYHDTLLLLNR